MSFVLNYGIPKQYVEISKGANHKGHSHHL